MTQLLDLTLDSPAGNLALDEALLNEAEAASGPTETLRLWESPQPMVVVGRASRVADEVDLAACRARGIPVYRRCSGGTSVLAGPGCLMYAVVLSYARHPRLRQLDHAHSFVMDRMQSALATLNPTVRYQGTCDLTIRGRKISGNALRCKRRHLLYHGAILYRFPLSLISACLGNPPRQPDYRAGRSHDEFLANLDCSVDELRRAIVQAWQAVTPIGDWPRQATQELASRQYSQDAWNFRL